MTSLALDKRSPLLSFHYYKLRSYSSIIFLYKFGIFLKVHRVISIIRNIFCDLDALNQKKINSWFDLLKSHTQGQVLFCFFLTRPTKVGKIHKKRRATASTILFTLSFDTLYTHIEGNVIQKTPPQQKKEEEEKDPVNREEVF